MFVLREADPRDIDDLFELAGMATFINLPRDRGLLAKKVAKSVQSFRGKLKDSREAEYLFVLEDRSLGKIIGTSMIVGQHGTPDEPHTYFMVLPKRKISKSLHMGFLHQVLRLGFDYDGPTEFGGLVLKNEYRSHPEKLGLLLSFLRFAYVAARRPQFRDEILCELMPPFNERGESPIWEGIGRKFTNLRYDEADRLSRRNKEFITSLFPEGDIYTCMLDAEAREAIGQVGPETQGVKRMLESIGFRYRNMIDPFDGGPHYWVKTDRADPLRRTRRVRKSARKEAKDFAETEGLLLNFSKRGLRAARVSLRLKGAEFVASPEVEAELGIEETTECYFLELKATP
jgi:arginine N-succinyltransferase